MSKDSTQYLEEDITEIKINDHGWTIAHLIAYGEDEYYGDDDEEEGPGDGDEIVDNPHVSMVDEDSLELFKHGSPKFLCQPSDEGQTPLHLAIRQNRLSIVNTYGNRKMCLNKSTNERDTPLHYAALFDRGEAAAILLDSGAHENAKNDEGKTPRDYAVKRGYDDVVAVIDQAVKAREKYKEENFVAEF